MINCDFTELGASIGLFTRRIKANFAPLEPTCTQAKRNDDETIFRLCYAYPLTECLVKYEALFMALRSKARITYPSSMW